MPIELAENLRPTSHSFDNYSPEPVQYSLNLEPATLTEATDVIKELRMPPPGHDDVNIQIN